MPKMSFIFLYFVFTQLLAKSNSTDSTGSTGSIGSIGSIGSSQPKNLLFTADFKDSEEFIFSSTNDYIKLSVAKDRAFLGRSTYPTCFAVGCTKTSLICEQKNGRMISTFRSVNDTRQAYFKSTLVADDIVLTVNCRESHTACCFEGTKKLNAVAMPPIRPPSPVKPQLAGNRPIPPTILLTPLRPLPSKVRPTILLTPLKHILQSNTKLKPPNNSYQPIVSPSQSYGPPLPANEVVPQLAAYNQQLIPSEAMPPNESINYLKKKNTFPELRLNPILKNKEHKSEMRTKLEPIPPKTKLSVEVPATLSSPLQVELHQITPPTPLPPKKQITTTTTEAPKTTTGPTTPPTPKPIVSSNRPIKIYLFSNICMGFLGGAGFVDCNG